ncbi:MAG TPA: SDR family oxidoreductase [Terriglobales bacterium]
MRQTTEPNRRTALVTGASGGIGLELAKLLARDGYNLVLAARSGDKLQKLADELSRACSVAVEPEVIDLSGPGAARELFSRMEQKGIAPEVLVNNAGYGKYGLFADAALEDTIGQIQLNVLALTELTRLLLPGMIARGSGKILNVASTAAFQPGPLMAVYYATKAYVLSFSQAIANELQGTGVTVTCLCPGPTETGFAARAGNDTSRLFKRFAVMDAESVARDGYRVLMKGKPLAISGAGNWVVAQSSRFAPRRMATAVSRWVSEKSE